MALTDSARVLLAQAADSLAQLTAKLDDIQRVHDHQIALRDQQIADLQANDTTALQQRVAELEDALAEAHQDIEAYLSEIAFRDSQIVDLRAEGDRLQSLVDTLESQVASLQAALAACESGGTPDPEPEPEPEPQGTVFSIDISQLAGETWGDMADQHRARYGPYNYVRVFFGPGETFRWDDYRFAPFTAEDKLLVSFKDPMTEAQFRSIVQSTPARFKVLPNQIRWCFKHESEAEYVASANKTVWLGTYHGQYAMMAKVLNEEGFDGNDVVKILLWYSQHVNASGATGTWDEFYGGQQFGYIGMDCYSYRTWANQQDRYASGEELFGLLVDIGAATGLPICVPEWGAASMATTDTDGTRLAAAITEQGNYAKDNDIEFVNWWCAQGHQGDQHLERFPAVRAAFEALRG